MKSFAFILSPINIKQLKRLLPILKIVPDFLITRNLKNNPPFKASRIEKIKSTQGKEIQGFIIICPLLPRQMLGLDKDFVLEKILSSARLAKQLDAKIIGLGGYTGIVGDKGLTIAKKSRLPVTTGKAFTAWSVFEAIYRVAREKNISLPDSKLAIIGAGGSLGYLCASKLSEYIPKIIVADGSREKLYRLKERVLEISRVEIAIEDSAHNAVRNANIVINASALPEPLFKLEELNPGAVVCDVSPMWNIADNPNNRGDITVIKGGLIKVPSSPDELIHASLAETMLLTLEDKFTSYSLGDTINLDKLEEIADISARHGFEVWVPQAPLL